MSYGPLDEFSKARALMGVLASMVNLAVPRPRVFSANRTAPKMVIRASEGFTIPRTRTDAELNQSRIERYGREAAIRIEKNTRERRDAIRQQEIENSRRLIAARKKAARKAKVNA